MLMIESRTWAFFHPTESGFDPNCRPDPPRVSAQKLFDRDAVIVASETAMRQVLLGKTLVRAGARKGLIVVDADRERRWHSSTHGQRVSPPRASVGSCARPGHRRLWNTRHECRGDTCLQGWLRRQTVRLGRCAVLFHCKLSELQLLALRRRWLAKSGTKATNHCGLRGSLMGCPLQTRTSKSIGPIVGPWLLSEAPVLGAALGRRIGETSLLLKQPEPDHRGLFSRVGRYKPAAALL